MATIYHDLSTTQLRQALQLREQIETLQRKLDTLLGSGGAAPAATTKKKLGRPAGKRKMSAEARAKIGAAQKARWAKSKAVPSKAPAKTVAKKKGGMTPEAKAKIATAMKARWEAKRKATAATA